MRSKGGLIEIKILKVMKLILMGRSRVWPRDWKIKVGWSFRLLDVR